MVLKLDLADITSGFLANDTNVPSDGSDGGSPKPRKPEVISDKLYVWLPASLLILVMMLCINYIGQALRRASDAKQRKG